MTTPMPPDPMSVEEVLLGEAGLGDEVRLVTKERLREILAAARREENEAIAKMVEAEGEKYMAPDTVCDAMAAAIRARVK
jgi:hypothetical protein